MRFRRLKDSESNGMLVRQKRTIRSVYKLGAAFVVVALLSSVLTLSVFGAGPTGFGTVIGPGSMVGLADYIIFYDDAEGKYFSKNGTTGEMSFSSVNATSVIQQSLDAHSSGRVYVVDGNYPINYRIMLPSNIHFFGGGVNTILSLEDEVNDRMIVNSDRTGGNSNITVSGFAINGNRFNQSALGEIDAWGNAGCLDFRMVTDLEVSSCVIVNPHEAGIETTFCHGVRIYNNRIYESGDDGIGINEDSHNVTVYGNIITNAGVVDPYGGPNGIELQDGSSHISVVGNVINGTYTDGIQVSTHAGATGVHNFTITGNTISNTNGAGIKVSTVAGEWASDFVVTANILSFCGAEGVTVRYARNGQITGNTVTYSGQVLAGQSGILVDESKNIAINDNSLSKNKYRGIEVDGCSVISVSANLLEYVVWDAILIVDSANASINSNIVVNVTGQNGIQIETSVDFIINDNIVMGARKGIDVDGGSFGLVSGNLVKYCREHGIHIEVASNNITVSDNLAIDNGQGLAGSQVGIGVRGDHCWIERNHCQDTGSGVQLYGIYVYAGADYNNITYNTLLNHATSNLGLSVATSFIAYNVGYVTEKTWTSTVTGAVSTLVVTHGMASTPVYVDVLGNNTGIGDVVVTTISSTTFTISFENQPATSIWKFYLYAQTW